MSEIPRLNGVIAALEQGKPAFATFAPADTDAALALSTSRYDGVVFEMEHSPWDVRAARDCFQYLLNRRQILERGTLAPAVTPMVRVPANGSEKNQFFAKQALDQGAYGLIFPHIGTAEEAYAAVAACRYARPEAAAYGEPAGLRGWGPGNALRYWGIDMRDYQSRADTWPLNPRGEILAVLMIEDPHGIGNLPDILKRVPGIGVILIGPGDLSQELGHLGEYDHPEVASAMLEIVRICKEYKVIVGNPITNAGNIERLLEQGYRFLMPSPERAYGALEKGLKWAGR